MRVLLFVVILAVILVIGAVLSGYVTINVRGQPPELTASQNRVTLKGGQAGAFDVEAGSVKVGTKPATVNLPMVEIDKPKDRATNNMM